MRGIDKPLALYIHVPFCRSRCSYCDFNTYVGLDHLIEPYVEAVARQIEIVGGSEHRPAHTVYFGGGTPSLLEPPLISRLMEACKAAFELTPDVEVTIEANPDSVEPIRLREWRAAGVNRLSLGMQSSNDTELRLFARRHNYSQVVQAVEWARMAGFNNIGLDLIYGAPEQTLTSWADTLSHALSLRPAHLSLYSLTVEPGTPMARWIDSGEIPPVDEDLGADMYEMAMDRLAAAGYVQYEISNWARPGYMCRHNIQYWRNEPYLGFGAGAHGFADGIRYRNVEHPAEFIRLMGEGDECQFPLSPATAEYDTVSAEQEMAETMMMGLRLTAKGVSLDEFERRFGIPLMERYGNQVAELRAQGLLELKNGRLRLTRRGRLLGNLVFMRFI